MLRELPHTHDPRVLAGLDLADDAGIFRLRDDLALIQTVDFFTPIVDDPYTFGVIAAANALSDIYAMGGTPMTALNIAVYPSKTVPIAVLTDILRGGADKAEEAGVQVIGGHTVEGEEPMYGLAVSGTIEPDRIVKSSGGREGDILVLTKPLGTGLVATALKAEMAQPDHVAAAIEWMMRLNRNASETMIKFGAHASTDITGFGLLGHLSQMARASGLAAEVSAERVPLMPGAFEYAHRGLVPSGGHTNIEFVTTIVEVGQQVDADTMVVLNDPQTSGGLLMAVAVADAELFLDDLSTRRENGWVIGRLVAGEPGRVAVT